MAHQTVGAKAAAEGLVSIGVQARFLDERFWPGIYRESRHLAEPRVQPYGSMQAQLRAALRHPQAPG